MDNTYAPTAPTQEKIKVESIDIVVTGPKKKPYYTIKCRKMKAVHSIREMVKNHIQAMEYLSMHGCHCRNHTGRSSKRM